MYCTYRNLSIDYTIYIFYTYCAILFYQHIILYNVIPTPTTQPAYNLWKAKTINQIPSQHDV